MPVSYDKAESVRPYLDEMLGEHHGELRDAGVTFDLLFARAEHDEDGNCESAAVKVGGYPASAKVRIVSLKDRAKGNGDIEIIIDEDAWSLLTETQRNALIDHELEHCELQLEEIEDGAQAVVKRDDLGRPKLKMRLHDRQFGWFDICAERHGADSFEARQLAEFQDSEQFRMYASEQASV